MKSYKLEKWIFLMIIFSSHSQGFSQTEFLFTKKFTRTIERYDLEFYLPPERWIKVAPMVEDDYMQYDIVLHSPPNIELRIDIDKDDYRLFPNVEIGRIISHISTNDDDAIIEITQYPHNQARERYGADFVLYTDFVPKVSYSTYPHGRLLCIYKEGRALIKYVILYTGEFDPYFNLPLRFRDPQDQ